jgi:hypothetical protein
VLQGQAAEVAELRARAAELQAEAAGLQSQVADLAARVSQNSHNSSRSPSSDGLAKLAPKSLRKKSGRKPGRPKGQPGATVALTDSPDRRVRHVPSCCAGAGAPWPGRRRTGWSAGR